MKIIERGESPSEKVYRARCMKCRTLVEFKAGEARFESDQRDGDALAVACPVCKAEIWTLVNPHYSAGGYYDR